MHYWSTVIHLTFISKVKEKFEDTKGVIRILISKKNRQHNDQKKINKRTYNDLHNIHIKLKIELYAILVTLLLWLR